MLSIDEFYYLPVTGSDTFSFENLVICTEHMKRVCKVVQFTGNTLLAFF